MLLYFPHRFWKHGPGLRIHLERPLPLDPKNKLFEGALKNPSQMTPKTPLTQDAIASGVKDKENAAPKVLTRKPGAANKKKEAAADPSKKRNVSAVAKTYAEEPVIKKTQKDSSTPTSIVVRSTPSSFPLTTRPTPVP